MLLFPDSNRSPGMGFLIVSFSLAYCQLARQIAKILPIHGFILSGEAGSASLLSSNANWTKSIIASASLPRFIRANPWPAILRAFLVFFVATPPADAGGSPGTLTVRRFLGVSVPSHEVFVVNDCGSDFRGT
jgi:hypothetical protein